MEAAKRNFNGTIKKPFEACKNCKAIAAEIKEIEVVYKSMKEEHVRDEKKFNRVLEKRNR